MDKWKRIKVLQLNYYEDSTVDVITNDGIFKRLPPDSDLKNKLDEILVHVHVCEPIAP